MHDPKLKPATLAAQALHYVDAATGGLVPPVQPSTTFARDAAYALINPAHSYGRDDIPGYRQVEAVLCALEGGTDALVFPSGMAAIAALFRTLKRGEAVVAQRPIYYGATAWLEKFCARREIGLTFAPILTRWRPRSIGRDPPSCGSRRHRTRCST